MKFCEYRSCNQHYSIWCC